MCRKLLLIGSIALFILGCAQTKTLTGGEKDMVAPIPVKMSPANESTRFNSKTIEITFDEYVKLNSPTQNISIVPNDAKIKTTLKDRTMIMELTGDLRDNTTYSIFINRAVKDIHEGKDSIMQYVFSTGDFIDSLTYSLYILDAQSNQPINGVTVGLFDHKDSIKPLYFTQSDQGKANFKYLKEGSYYLRAFDDVNRDGKLGKYEKTAFHVEPVTVPQKGDTINLRFFQPQLAPDITTWDFKAPGMFVLGANSTLNKDSIFLNGDNVPTERMRWHSTDSLFIFDAGIENNSNQITVRNEWVDSTRLRIPTTRTKVFKLTEFRKDITAADTFYISTTGLIQSIDTSKVKWTRLSDTTAIPFDYQIDRDRVYFFPQVKFEKSTLNIYPNAVEVVEGWRSSTLMTNVNLLKENELGVLNINLSYYQRPIVLELFNNKKLVKSLYLNSVETVEVKNLIPGDYTFRILLDDNENGKWDSGDFLLEQQPEQLHIYSTPTKVRANWEMDVTLEPNKGNE